MVQVHVQRNLSCALAEDGAVYCWGDAGGTSADELKRLFKGHIRPYRVHSGQPATRLFGNYLGVHAIDRHGTVHSSGHLSKCTLTQDASDSFAALAHGWQQKYPEDVHWNGFGAVRSARLLPRSATVPTNRRVFRLNEQATCHRSDDGSLACVDDCGDEFPGRRPLPRHARVRPGYLLDERTPTISSLGSKVFGPLAQCFPAESERGECGTEPAFEVELAAHAREFLMNEHVLATLDASGECSLFLRTPSGELSPQPERFGTGIQTIAMMDAPLTVCGVESDGSVLCRIPGPEDLRWEKTRTIAEATNIVQLSGGSTHMCGLRVDGRVMCWGWNANGELGNGDGAAPRGPQAHASLVVAPTTSQSSGPRNARRLPYGFQLPETPNAADDADE